MHTCHRVSFNCLRLNNQVMVKVKWLPSCSRAINLWSCLSGSHLDWVTPDNTKAVTHSAWQDKVPKIWYIPLAIRHCALVGALQHHANTFVTTLLA